MLQINVNETLNYTVSKNADSTIIINDKIINADVSTISESIYHIINDHQSYNVEVVSLDVKLKTAQIRVSSNIYHLSAKDQFDLLLDKMGMSNLNSAKVSELKAPMPGLVLKVFVKDNDTVTKGDNLLILEAMKMENIIKAPADGIIKTIKIQPGDKVEKAQVLIQFA